MRRAFLALVIVVTAVTIFSTSLGILAGVETGGRERYYIGASVLFGDDFGIGVDVYYPISSFKTLTEEIAEAKIVELDPGVFLSASFKSLKLYIVSGPMVIFNLENYTYSLVPLNNLRGKIGLRLKLGSFSVFLEGITAFSYSPIALGGIYGVQGGIALGF